MIRNDIYHSVFHWPSINSTKTQCLSLQSSVETLHLARGKCDDNISYQIDQQHMCMSIFRTDRQTHIDQIESTCALCSPYKLHLCWKQDTQSRFCTFKITWIVKTVDNICIYVPTRGEFTFCSLTFQANFKYNQPSTSSSSSYFEHTLVVFVYWSN